MYNCLLLSLCFCRCFGFCFCFCIYSRHTIFLSVSASFIFYSPSLSLSSTLFLSLFVCAFISLSLCASFSVCFFLLHSVDWVFGEIWWHHFRNVRWGLWRPAFIRCKKNDRNFLFRIYISFLHYRNAKHLLRVLQFQRSGLLLL